MKAGGKGRGKAAVVHQLPRSDGPNLNFTGLE